MPFRHSDAAALCGVPASTLRNWADRGLAPAFSPHVKGRSRRFNSRDILAATVMGNLSDSGVPLWDALGIAKATLAKLNEYCNATGSDDIAEDIKAAGLDKATLFFWQDGTEWRTHVEADFGWGAALARADGETFGPLPARYSTLHVYWIAKDVAERIRAFEAAKKAEAK